jgi:hypothetical protein
MVVYGRSNSWRKNYDYQVIFKVFLLRELEMLWDTTVVVLIGNKLKPMCQGPYSITGYAKDHEKTYTLAQISSKKIWGTFHGNHLWPFRLHEGYLILKCELQLSYYQNLPALRVPMKATCTDNLPAAQAIGTTS